MAACDVKGAWLPLIFMLQSCEFLKVILEAQVIQIYSMDILNVTIDSLVLKYGVLWRMATSCRQWIFAHLTATASSVQTLN